MNFGKNWIFNKATANIRFKLSNAIEPVSWRYT
ncbi:hypothetical protein A5875_004290, partial [Enterococcus sp. 3H8_DIV0648]